ncbi:MAG: hypothetical protein DDT42_01298 [candidate division WS2 bacterium]|uniref:Uncharacterized protein n=1 Tax=Psychracetigena formicireducens TaxID=2986056 RepID=A0A9E2BH38_PSYF1|nr:hypothetical protein [Candidatus Psychracetigena formicireducens]
MVLEFDKEEHKELVKEAIKEWLDDQFAKFGRWTIRSLAAIIFTAIVVFLANHGFIK